MKADIYLLKVKDSRVSFRRKNGNYIMSPFMVKFSEVDKSWWLMQLQKSGVQNYELKKI